MKTIFGFSIDLSSLVQDVKRERSNKSAIPIGTLFESLMVMRLVFWLQLIKLVINPVAESEPANQDGAIF